LPVVLERVHFAEIAVRVVDAALPARALLLGAGQRPGEREVLLDERAGQEFGIAVRQLPAQVGLQVGQRRRREDLVDEPFCACALS
jgi:hypothetical protein